ncbi:carcinoembryonic antigen-related cell adhesion molecule 5 [Xyrauchen texanus]|uniref:carcinoembryonic antigen-related cell adhesion molecule 5 n=1 Tax=Xyrauchen texanus TaxID=154827 RepID=UPI002241FDBD|nr:carcinoembryonic antigen-related cell adhesion molecule 5 [Xyrauchen texanus]
MDLNHFRLPLLFLATLGCCSEGSPLLNEKVNGVIGKNVTFKTTITDTGNFLTVIWNFNNGKKIVPIVTGLPNGNIIDDKYAARIKYNKTTWELQLVSLMEEDSGEYTLAIVTTSGSQLSGQVLLEVLEPVSDVTIISSLTEAVEINSTVVLTCSAKGSFTYMWINGSGPVVPDGAHIMLNSNGNELTVSEVHRTDLRGPIFCIAKNALESGKSAPFNLSVSYGPENIVMKQTPAMPFLKKGSNLTLTCAADSDPPAQLQWMFNGAELQSQMATVTIAKLEETHSGNYSCVAYNTKTKRKVVSQVAVVSVLDALSGTNITSPASLLIAGNSTVSLTCKAAAGNADNVEWLKDGKPLAPGERVILSADKSIVTIAKVAKEDASVYKCKLTNKVSTDEATYKLLINYGPENVKVSGKNAVKFDETIEISCSAESVPASTYTWKLNETMIDFSLASLRIEKASQKDSGTYTCEAHNPITGMTMKTTHKLAVTELGLVDEGLSGGAIAGIVIAVIIAIIIIACIYCCCKKTEDVPSPY